MWAARASELFKKISLVPDDGESRTAIKGKGKGVRVLRLFHAPTPTRPFPPCRGETACCFSLQPVPFIFPLPYQAQPLPLLSGSRQKTNLRTRKKRSSFQHGATGERDTFPISLTALHFPLEIPVFNHLPPNRFIQNRRLFQKPPFLSFSSLSLPCPTGLGRQIAL